MKAKQVRMFESDDLPLFSGGTYGTPAPLPETDPGEPPDPDATQLPLLTEYNIVPHYVIGTPHGLPRDPGYVRHDIWYSNDCPNGSLNVFHVDSIDDLSPAFGSPESLSGCSWCYLGYPHSTLAHNQSVRAWLKNNGIEY